MGRYHVISHEVTKGVTTVTEWSCHGHVSQVTSHSHNMWQRSQLTSSMETMEVKEHCHIVIVYIV